jgi:hypothetical protein
MREVMSIQYPSAVPVVLGALTVISAAGSVGFATETTFKTHCAKCHGRVAALARNLEGETRDERVAALSRFLEDHHLDDPAARAAIVKCLVEQTDP